MYRYFKQHRVMKPPKISIGETEISVVVYEALENLDIPELMESVLKDLEQKIKFLMIKC